MPTPKLYIGCPVWACEHWKGSLFTAKAPRSEWLHQYSSAMNTVEGNSTFYALPSLETAKRWASSVRPEFQFCLKLPRAISHDRRLVGAEKELEAFLQIAEALASAQVLGPSFLQLPPDFSSREQPALERFLEGLPSQFPWALEVRHPDWFDSGQKESELDALLSETGIDKVLFDSRPLYSQPASDDVERESQRRKPRTPIRTTVTGAHPFLRIVGRNRLDDVQPWIDEWAPTIAHWLRSGREPFVFTHAPDDRFAPDFTRRMHNAIRSHLPELSELPAWPGELEKRQGEQQMLLF